MGGAIWVAVAKARSKEPKDVDDSGYTAVELEDNAERDNRSVEFEVGDEDEDRRRSGEFHRSISRYEVTSKRSTRR